MEMLILLALFGFFFCGGRAPSAMEEAQLEEKAKEAFQPKQ
jgi:hypothetical protein